MDRFAIILAAGKGSRMKSLDENHSKVSYPILGKALVNYVLDALEPLNIKKTVTVVGFGGQATTELVKNRSEVVWQHELKGTGHAVMQTESILKGQKGETVILCGDTPLITSDLIDNLLKTHEEQNNSLTLVSAILDNPMGYGRIIRDSSGNVVAIREDRDCNKDEHLINETNAGFYVFDNGKLFDYLSMIKPNNSQNEYYLTDLIDMFVRDGLKVGAYISSDAVSTYGINDRVQLAYAAKVIKKRVNNKLMLSGVTIEDPDNTYISIDAQIGRDCVIAPNTTILGKVVIGENNSIGPNSYLNNVNVGKNNKIANSYLENIDIGNDQIIIGENKCL